MTLTTITLLLIATVTLGATAVALFLKDIIHCAILLVASWVGIAAFYLWAGAEFVAFAQILVYVGAVSMVVLFAVLLTQRKQLDLEKFVGKVGFRELGKLAAALVATVIVFAVVTTPLTLHEKTIQDQYAATTVDAQELLKTAPSLYSLYVRSCDAASGTSFSTKEIGAYLATTHVSALLIIGVLLTVALLGAVVIASAEPKTKE